MIFGIAGQKRVGKDETGNRILHYLDAELTGRKIAYADKLKDSFCGFLGIDRDQLEDLKSIEHQHPSTVQLELIQHHDGGMAQIHNRLNFREALERFGTEGHRNIFGETFWVDITFPEGYKPESDITIVCDVRFPNEAQRIIDLGGKIIRVLDGPPSPPTHEAEQILDSSLISYEIDNSIRDDKFYNLDLQVLEILKKEKISVKTGEDHAARYSTQ